jgi:signal transduction histidine kinase/HPt (histidine-containing phosphotransfer) domain-containing protein
MLHHKHVLIIDDSDTIRTYLENVLTQKGAFVVDGAATGEEGLARCAAQAYDLILLDLLLPDTDGIELLKNIRTRNEVSTIVMITGYGGVKSAITAVQMGADGYIEKQNITSTLKDHVEFLYALDQAMEHRAGLFAKKQLEQIRADFYAMVTHDLRNPTSLILMATDMLLNEDSEPPQQQQLIYMINQAANRLVRLINDYLDFAQIDAGFLRLDVGEVDLIQVVESSAGFAHLQAQARQQTLVLDVPPGPVSAWVDAERLKQVLDNLLSNAIKYTPEGGQITLRLAVEEGQAVFSVSDTGSGIPPQHLPRLFAKYHRVPGEATRGIVGSGLGLLIVKEIVEAHGGTVQAASEGIPGKGTTFTVRIPLQRDQVMAQSVRLPPKTDHEPEPAIEKDMTGDLAQDPEFRRLFWEETRKHLSVIQDALAEPSLMSDDRNLLDKARQASHTLKGNAGAMQLSTLYELAAQLDNTLQQAAKGSLVLTPAQQRDLLQLLDRIVSMAANGQDSETV